MSSASPNEMRRARYADLMLAAALLVVGLGGFVFINPTGADVTTGPGGLSWRTLPFVYSSILLGLVALYIASTLYDLRLIARGQPPRSLLGERNAGTSDPATRWRQAATVLALTLYAFGIEAFGFALMTPLLLFAMFHVFGRSGWQRNALVAIVGAFVMWILFMGILKMPLQGDVWDPLTPVLTAAYSLTGAR